MDLESECFINCRYIIKSFYNIKINRKVWEGVGDQTPLYELIIKVFRWGRRGD